MNGKLIAAAAAVATLSFVRAGHPGLPRPAAAQESISIVRVWSRLVTHNFNVGIREVIEFRPDGTYISGLCGTTINSGFCQDGQVTASRQGAYAIQGNVVTLARGLVRVTEAPPEAQETYRWRAEQDPPDYPPHPCMRPPLRKIYLTSAREELMFSEFPAANRPRWVPRSR
jgi:hypothetical protein